MSVHRVSELLKEHVTLEVEGIDRMFLNAYVPGLQTPEGVAWFLRSHRGQTFASSALMEPMSKAFVAAIEAFVKSEQIRVITFQKGQRKDDIAKQMRVVFDQDEGVVFVGKAQEKAPVIRTEKRTNPQTGQKYPWLVRSTAMVNQYYFYIEDSDFGPLFIKFRSYFPYTAKVCINGHEWLKRQLQNNDIAFEALDNGILSCDEPERVQRIADQLEAAKIESLFRKWLGRLPHPYPAADRKAGYRYDLSILQAEFSLTMVLNRPTTGRVFFEEVIRENLDIGRPDHVQLNFDRRVNRKTPGRFRTRVITRGVIPSLHVDYKKSRIKEYFKEGRAFRVETTINDTRDFGIGKRLANLPQLRGIGFAANRRLLDVQTVSHDCAVGEDTWDSVVRPVTVGDQRASALRFDDPRVQALFLALVLFVLHTDGFRSTDLREPLAQLLGIDPAQLTRGRMTYDLRRLRLHGIIERIPRTHRFRASPLRVSASPCSSLAHGLDSCAQVSRSSIRPFPINIALRRAFDTLETEIESFVEHQRLVA